MCWPASGSASIMPGADARASCLSSQRAARSPPGRSPTSHDAQTLSSPRSLSSSGPRPRPAAAADRCAGKSADLQSAARAVEGAGAAYRPATATSFSLRSRRRSACRSPSASWRRARRSGAPGGWRHGPADRGPVRAGSHDRTPHRQGRGVNKQNLAGTPLLLAAPKRPQGRRRAAEAGAKVDVADRQGRRR